MRYSPLKNNVLSLYVMVEMKTNGRYRNRIDMQKAVGRSTHVPPLIGEAVAYLSRWNQLRTS